VDTLIDVIRGINTGERGQLEKRKEDERRANNREIKKAEIERANIGKKYNSDYMLSDQIRLYAFLPT